VKELRTKDNNAIESTYELKLKTKAIYKVRK